MRAGFLVVLRDSQHQAARERNYRGVDRLVPVVMGRAGPVVTPSLLVPWEDHTGLISTEEGVGELIDAFAVEGESRVLQVIYASQREAESHRLNEAWPCLGFDVAAPGAPFWSILSEMPQGLKARITTNQSGLMDDSSDALDIANWWSRGEFGHPEFPLVVWKIRVVREEIKLRTSASTS